MTSRGNNCQTVSADQIITRRPEIILRDVINVSFVVDKCVAPPGSDTESQRRQLVSYFDNKLSRPIWTAGRRRGNPSRRCVIWQKEGVIAKYYRKIGERKEKRKQCDHDRVTLTKTDDKMMKLFDIRNLTIDKVQCESIAKKGVLAFSSNDIDYGDIWDSTKGYPGEGHDDKKDKLKKRKAQKVLHEAERKDNEEKLIRLATEAKRGRIHNVKEAIQFLESVVDQTEMIQSEDERKIAETLSDAQEDGKRIIGSIMSINARGMNGKMYDERGLEFYAFMNKHHAMAICMQDHKMREWDKQRLLKNMEYCVTNLRPNKNITMQEGLKGRSTTRHGGTTSVMGGKLAVYSGEKIVDPRGWGRISGRKIDGVKELQSISDLAIVSYYGPSPAAGEGPQWSCQDSLLETVPKRHRKDNPRQQGLSDPKMMVQT